MSFEMAKTCSRKVGMYRAARWVHGHLINRQELRALQRDLAFYSQFVSSGSLCFDVGANYGLKSEVFLRLGAKVIAFEPQPDCIEELQARLGQQPRLVAINAAVGSGLGRQTLYIEKHRTASSLVQAWQGEVVGTLQVPVTTLDEAIVRFGSPQFCKIDVEGYELEVLKGLSQSIPALSFEYHLRSDGIARALACVDYLSELGEAWFNITPAEKPMFARSQWWRKGEFADYFRHNVPAMPGYDYGDIFVSVSEAGSHGHTKPR